MSIKRLVLCVCIFSAMTVIARAQCNPTQTVTVRATIVVNGTTFNGNCTRYKAGPELGDGGQGENQKPVFKVVNGTLLNVVLGAPAADGIHTEGNVTLRNVHWEDIGEDALTVKKSGNVTIDGGSARLGSDKVFQINAACTFTVRNFTADTAGKFIRQNGGKTFKVTMIIDRCTISNMSECIARTDSSTTTVRMTNTRYRNIKKSLFIGFASGNVTQSGNTQF